MSDIRGIEALRAELFQVMATTRDIELLRRALQVLRGGSSKEAIGYQPAGRSVSLQEYEALIAQSQRQIENGEYVTLEELEEESKS